jgi:hypothetical protein
MHQGHSLPEQYKFWLESSAVEPSVVFKTMLSDSVTSINSRLDKFDSVLDHTIRNVNRAVYVFIDKVDQGICELPKDAWCNVQGGLLEAAWDCSSTNAHLKVFGTVRDEAYANYGSSIKSNVRSGVVQLKYSLKDLRDMIDTLTNAYEGYAQFSEFVGLSTVRNTRAEIVEESFDYVNRHAVGRPRDLVHVCSALSEAGEPLTEGRFRKIVNDESANNVVSNLFDEMSAFLRYLQDQNDRARFFSMLPYNIMTQAEVQEIAASFGQFEEGIGPFLDLWNCGLIGTVDENVVENDCMQTFKQPHQPFRFDVRQLPQSKVYLLHPSLQMVVKQQRAADGYHVYRFIVVGNEKKWHRHDELLVDVQRELFRLSPNDEICNAVEASLPYIHAALSEGRGIDEYFCGESRRKFEEQMQQADGKEQYHGLCEAVRKAWVKWNDTEKCNDAQQPSNATQLKQ